MEPKIKLENISKSYQLYSKQSDKILDMFIPSKRKSNRTFNALSKVSFEIQSGETVGIVGINGSGKSTLSNILAEVIQPSEGTMTINGETSLIAINAGLNKQLSGLENIELKCLMLGLQKEEIQEITPKIIEFADIGQFMDQPVKNYSSGMKSRLGFAISAHIDPDILIVDEALSVGDKTFYQKCLDKINEFKANGKTIIFISHSIGQMRSISDRVLWIHHGKVREFGDAKNVLDKYEEFINWFNGLNKQEKQQYNEEKLKEQQVLDSKKRKIRVDRKRNNRNGSLFFQIAALILITFLTAFFMFIDKSPLAFYSEFKSEKTIEEPTLIIENEEVLEALPQVSSINKNGVIKSREATLFLDEEIENELQKLPFSTEVFVEEQIEDVYKVKFEDQVGYMMEEHVTVAELNSATVDMNLYELLPLYPSTVSPSYEFFFSFFNSGYEAVKNGLLGLSEEGEEDGLSFLEYSSHNVKYLFNEANRVNTIVLSNINLDEQLLDSLHNNANLVSDDGNLLLVNLEEYEILIDIEKMELSIYYVNASTEEIVEVVEGIEDDVEVEASPINSNNSTGNNQSETSTQTPNNSGQSQNATSGQNKSTDPKKSTQEPSKPTQPPTEPSKPNEQEEQPPNELETPEEPPEILTPPQDDQGGSGAP